MELPLSLEKMSVADKLRAMEQIWEDLSRTPENLPSPSWHEDVLRAREKRARRGAARFHDWNDAKKAIRDSTK
jgi:hypothetical protein